MSNSSGQDFAPTLVAEILPTLAGKSVGRLFGCFAPRVGCDAIAPQVRWLLSVFRGANARAGEAIAPRETPQYAALRSLALRPAWGSVPLSRERERLCIYVYICICIIIVAIIMTMIIITTMTIMSATVSARVCIHN